MTTKLDLRIARRTVQEEVVDKLKQAILSGMFVPGERRVEARLCNSLGVSRQSLREALRSLHAERLIEIVPNRGPQIPVLSWPEAEQIYEVRELLEAEATARCATRITDDELDVMAGCLVAFRRAVRTKDSLEQVRVASQFANVILRNCGNAVLEQLHEGLVARINMLRARSMSVPGRTKASLAEIEAIYEALRKRDVDKARRLARIHVLNACAAAKAAFDL